MAILDSDGNRSFVGRCIRESESNRYDDSDFFMLVWNDEAGKPESKMFATTRAGCGVAYGSRVDADESTLAKYALYCERRAQASSKAIRETALSRAREVRNLESKVPGYVKLRKAYCPRLSFLDPRVLDGRDNGLDDYLSLLDLLSNKRIRSAFKLNLRSQVQAWIDDESPRYDQPLSPRQMAYLPLKGLASLAPAVEPDYSSIVVFDDDVQDTEQHEDANQKDEDDNANMGNIESLEQSISDARYHTKHFAAPNMRNNDKRHIDVMEAQLASLKRQAGVGCQLPLWLPINPYNKVPVYNDIGQQTGWVF